MKEWTPITEAAFNDVYTESRWNNQVRGNLHHIRDNVGHIPLSLLAAIAPLSLTPPALTQVESSGAAPEPNWFVYNMDATSDEGLQWNFIVPPLYGTSAVLKVKYCKAAGTTGAVVFGARIAAVSDGEVLISKTFGDVNTVTDTVPSTAGYVATAEISMVKVDGMAAGDFATLYLYRDADNGSDNTTGDVGLIYAEMTYAIA